MVADATTTQTTASVPTKPATQSVSVWAGIASVIIGFLVQFGVVSQELATAIGANLNDFIGAIMTLIGIVGTFAALRRKTLLRF